MKGSQIRVLRCRVPLAGWCAVPLPESLVVFMVCPVLSPHSHLSQMFAAEENVDFRIHVENQTRARDDVSRKQLRLYQLYSRTSGKHIQVLGRRISAKGEDGDKYGKNIYWDPPDVRSKALIQDVVLRTSWEKNNKSNKKQDKRKKPFPGQEREICFAGAASQLQAGPTVLPCPNLSEYG